MKQDRRQVLTLLGGSAIGAGMLSPLSGATSALSAYERPKIKAVAFDAFPIFDPRHVFKVFQTEFPEKGDELRKLWFSKIFSYTWLRSAGDRYKEFWGVMADALHYSADSLDIKISREHSNRIMQSFLHLPLWPDVKPALAALRDQNIKLALLSNMSEEMLKINIKNNGIEGQFDFILSTDKVKNFKPSPKAYQLGVDAFGLKKQEIAFASFAPWDAAGARWFGYHSVWINRLDQRPDQLDAIASEAGKDLSTLISFIEETNSLAK